MLSAARSPSTPPRMPTVADGEPDDAARDRAAPCRTGARNAVTALAAVHGGRRAPRCAAHLQTRTIDTQKCCSAVRARAVMNTNGLSHREHCLERPATSSWLEELKDGGGAQPAAPPDGGCISSERLRVGERTLDLHTARERRCVPVHAIAAGLRRATTEEKRPPCGMPTCQLILVPPVQASACLADAS